VGLDPNTLARITDKLNGMLSELDAEVVTTVDGMRTGTGAFPDPTDRASLESERNLTLRIRDRERKLRNKIEEALARIVAGTFGICEVCGEDIGAERLEARPVTTLCINCKESQEKDESRLKTG
jgi:DnaK suppressor protein